MMRSSMGLRPAKPSSGAVPVRDAFFAQLPAQQDHFFAHDAGEIEQADVEVFHLHAGGVDFGDGVFGALQCLLAFGLAAAQRRRCRRTVPPFRKMRLASACISPSTSSISVLACDGGAQQRLQHGQQSLGFRNGKGARHIESPAWLRVCACWRSNNTTAVFPHIRPVPRNPPQEFLTRTLLRIITGSLTSYQEPRAPTS